MLHIPILRHGKPYESIDKITIVHHATGEPVAQVSQANAGLVGKDIRSMDDTVLEQFTVKELMAFCKKAGKIFMEGTLPVGDTKHSFDDYVKQVYVVPLTQELADYDKRIEAWQKAGGK
jgi:hypothetical protein